MPLQDLQFINDRKIFLKVRPSAMQNHRAIQILQDNRENLLRYIMHMCQTQLLQGLFIRAIIVSHRFRPGGSGEIFRLI